MQSWGDGTQRGRLTLRPGWSPQEPRSYWGCIQSSPCWWIEPPTSRLPCREMRDNRYWRHPTHISLRVWLRHMRETFNVNETLNKFNPKEVKVPLNQTLRLIFHLLSIKTQRHQRCVEGSQSWKEAVITHTHTRSRCSRTKKKLSPMHSTRRHLFK